MLKGCDCDPDNPIALQDCFIIHAIQMSQVARTDLCTLYPALFPCEKERLDLLFTDNPFLSKLRECVTDTTDTFQRRMNNIPVYTSGRDGGRRLPVGHTAQVINLPPHLAPKRQPQGCS